MRSYVCLPLPPSGSPWDLNLFQKSRQGSSYPLVYVIDRIFLQGFYEAEDSVLYQGMKRPAVSMGQQGGVAQLALLQRTPERYESSICTHGSVCCEPLFFFWFWTRRTAQGETGQDDVVYDETSIDLYDTSNKDVGAPSACQPGGVRDVSWCVSNSE